ncbi:MAG: MCE family protein [Ignavibacteriae bacterium]|nr:MCE family protein [Ignavibacteriota bacterium]MCB0723093.1 MCE family protein [Ignavibacteriota bacterium]MCB9242939.1 MCE family protein [Ignavibacteriales bacterium]
MTRQHSKLKVGIFVFIAIVIVLTTVFWTKGFVIGAGQNDVTVYFQSSVGGLNEGDAVTVKGVRKGEIQKITLVGDSVKVEFTLAKDVVIKSDYSVEVAMTSFTSGKQLYIDPGKQDPVINFDRPLIGSDAGDINTVMKQMKDLSTEVGVLITKFQTNSDKLNDVLINVNEIVGDGQLKMDLKSTMSNFEVTSRNLNALVSENRSSLTNITSKVDKTVTNVSDLVDETSPEFKRTFSEIANMTVKIDSLISNLNGLVSDVKTSDGTANQLIYDDQLYKNINKTLKEIEKLSEQIRKKGVKIDLF